MATVKAEQGSASTTGPTNPIGRTGWVVGVSSLLFILLQSACTAVMAISGVRLVIGLGALAAASGLHHPATGWHRDAVRIPLMTIAVAGSLVNLYVLWRVRTLRGRPASRWRMAVPSRRQLRSERMQFALAGLTLALVLAEWATHQVVHGL